MENIDSVNRNYNTISPSAKSLLFLKGYTNIPFARQTAELIAYPDKFIPDFTNQNQTFWARMVHFENRYWSIDQLLEELPVKNILELSSGFSFRGLEAIIQNDLYYIDTDLPDVVTLKNDIRTILMKEISGTEGELEILPLNALDEKQFHEIVSKFPEGEIVIVNEGLLMYLDTEEKVKLCSNILGILKERGGYWITADAYIKNQKEKINLEIDNKTKEFFEQHHIEDNKFESFEEAKAFFNRMGFIIDREAVANHSKLSSIEYFLKTTTLSQFFRIRKAGKMQATWRLRVAND